MTDKDPEDWLRELAGKARSDRAESPEIRPLREAIRERERRDTPGGREGLDALLSRLEREKLLAAPRRARQRRWLPAAAAASLVGVAVMVGLLMQPGEEPEPMRFRGMGQWLEIQVTDPESWVRETRDRLAAAGCSATLAENDGEEPRVLIVDANEACVRHLNEVLATTASQVDAPGRYRLAVTGGGEDG